MWIISMHRSTFSKTPRPESKAKLPETHKWPQPVTITPADAKQQIKGQTNACPQQAQGSPPLQPLPGPLLSSSPWSSIFGSGSIGNGSSGACRWCMTAPHGTRMSGPCAPSAWRTPCTPHSCRDGLRVINEIMQRQPSMLTGIHAEGALSSSLRNRLLQTCHSGEGVQAADKSQLTDKIFNAKTHHNAWSSMKRL